MTEERNNGKVKIWYVCGSEDENDSGRLTAMISAGCHKYI
jgi:hypothetical protein